MPSQNTTVAPVYRYFTADLLTNRILAEVPLRDVNFECAVTAAGKFSGKIPVIAATVSQDLYDSLMPGNTALYAVRNGKCVWGGIIWGRDYSLTSKDLRISASEFTSYFYHRKIWKTYNHKYGASVTYDDVTADWRVVFENGSNVAVKSGSTVSFEFFNTGEFGFNGYYRVKDTPSPTTDGFSIYGGYAVSDITSMEVGGGWWTIYTKENHGYSTGDSVQLEVTYDSSNPNFVPYTTRQTVNVPNGPDSNMFRISASGTAPLTVMDGVAYRPLPAGTYEDVTVTVRQDTFDYIRTLIDSMFDDFVGTDFPNVYIEPGISYPFVVASKQAYSGYAIIETEKPHNIAPGQAVQVRDVGQGFDGEVEITDTPSPTTLVYESPATSNLVTLGTETEPVLEVKMQSGVATLYFDESEGHDFSVGETVKVDLGEAFDEFNGSWTIDYEDGTTIQYKTSSSGNIPRTVLPNARISVGSNPVRRASVKNNVVTLELANSVTSTVGSSITVLDVNRQLRVSEKALDAPNSRASVKTTEDHGFIVGNTVTLSGLADTAETVSVSNSTTSATITTTKPHNFRTGQSITISGDDTFRITSFSVTGNTATFVTDVPMPASGGVVSGLYERNGISSKSLTNNVATVNTTGLNNLRVGMEVEISGIADTYNIVSKEANDGVVTITTRTPHNVLIDQKIAVAGLGAPFDGTAIEVVDTTATRIIYKIDQKYWDAQKATAAQEGQSLNVPVTVPLQKASGTVTVPDGFFNGTRTITSRTNTSFTYQLRGEDQASTGGGGFVRYLSSMNQAVTGGSVSGNTYTVLLYNQTVNDVPLTAVPAPVEGEAQAQLSKTSNLAGTRTITAVTSNTITVALSSTNASSRPASLYISRESIFNGTWVIAEVPTTDRFVFSLSGYSASALEQVTSNTSFAVSSSIYNGTYTVSAVNTAARTVSYTKTLADFPSKAVPTRGTATVSPQVIISTFGPFPGNANIGIKYARSRYTGVNIEPISYRGFELKSVGEALDDYTDNINGFEYRVDCAYDPEINQFTRTLVLIPINFPNPPAPGEVAPLSRYGADKLVFEYPGGNIIDATINESAENSATRFFAVGETDLGPDVGPNIGIASSEELLRGKDGRAWPLLDATESIDGVDNEEELYAYAERYLSEAAPPYTTLSVSVNGSIAPFVGDYHAGDWCSLIIDDAFVNMRLKSDLEPRDDVLVRKISSYRVKVPDGVTFPETVTLDLVAEWEVDKRD